ncbi:MAG: hypothetical protein ACRDV7_07330 [Acidimicrobiia bacterium]
MGLQRVDTTTGPVAVGGRTINLVTRTISLTTGRAPERLVGAWSRPRHLEILDADGRREIVKVRDVHVLATTVVAGVAAVCVLGARIAKGRR